MEMKKMCVGESGVPHNEIKIFFYNHGNKKKFFFSFAYFFLKNFRRGSIAEHNIIHSFFFVYRKKKQYKKSTTEKKSSLPIIHTASTSLPTRSRSFCFFCVSHSLATPCSICFANDPPSPSHHHLLTLTAVADA